MLLKCEMADISGSSMPAWKVFFSVILTEKSKANKQKNPHQHRDSLWIFNIAFYHPSLLPSPWQLRSLDKHSASSQIIPWRWEAFQGTGLGPSASHTGSAQSTEVRGWDCSRDEEWDFEIETRSLMWDCSLSGKGCTLLLLSRRTEPQELVAVATLPSSKFSPHAPYFPVLPDDRA